MAVTAKWYGLGMKHIMEGDVALDTDTIHIALIGSGYTANLDTDEFFSTPEASEASGIAYTAGGQALTTKTVTYDAASDQVRFNCADPQWAASTIANVTQAVVYKKRGGLSSADELLIHIDFGETKSSVAADFDVAVATNSLGYVDVT